ncbi:hypothetical protein E2C01_066683 [Portunus trituberculatus]|uniref:Uncharacterized protein n=1 Tax=Portunus trituberculatus TaxID=210409 RepID=A0A5B7HRJ1_PORTR|nr:hypothetical protein [Portunus trituberculatus]
MAARNHSTAKHSRASPRRYQPVFPL